MKPTGKPRGRPPKFTPQLANQLVEAFAFGFTDEEAAVLCNISEKTIRRIRLGNLCPEIKRAELARKAVYIRRITEGDRADWARWAWFLERRFPLQFAKPEIQLSVNNNNTTVNNTLVVTAEMAGEMKNRTSPIEMKIEKLLKEKRANGQEK